MAYVVVAATLCGLPLVYLGLVVAWGERCTRGLNYYGQSAPRRQRYRRVLAVQRQLLGPLLWALSRRRRFGFRSGSVYDEGLAAPRGSCTPQTLAAAARYEPTPQDVFIVTQMRCGTTWMQQIVYEVLTRGQADVASAGRTMCEFSPWLESVHGVPLDAAPGIGPPPGRRIIKTHLPAPRCPYAERAKYIYVTRHPVSCLASCISFLNENLREFAPRLKDIEAWFCSPQAMWWGTWPAHVRGWWQRSQSGDNVLFVGYEMMKRDLRSEVLRVAEFLGVPHLAASELDRILEHSSFAWMQMHAAAFEMHPPHLLRPEPAFFVSGRVDRYQDVPGEVGQRVMAWCRAELADCDFPWARFFPAVELPSQSAVRPAGGSAM